MQLLLGDCLEILKTLPDSSVDSLCCDPPAGINFMGKKWDDDKGGRKQWIAWMSDVMREALRVMKPGAHGLVWALPRTSHWTATALEDAGFEIRDIISHLFGSGFPKSLDISKAIDKLAGAEREVIPRRKLGQISDATDVIKGWKNSSDNSKTFDPNAVTPEAKQWQGWGTALKPAVEMWCLIRKPCSEKTVAANVLLHGVGGINIDASRIGGMPDDRNRSPGTRSGKSNAMNDFKRPEFFPNAHGRFPANLIFSHSPGCVDVGTKKLGSGDRTIGGTPRKTEGHIATGSPDRSNALMNYGTETVAAWECEEGCAVRLLDEQSLAAGMHGAGKSRSPGGWDSPSGIFGIGGGDFGGARKGDSGGASRFFKCFARGTNTSWQGLKDSQNASIVEVYSDNIKKQIVSVLEAVLKRVDLEDKQLKDSTLLFTKETLLQLNSKEELDLPTMKSIAQRYWQELKHIENSNNNLASYAEILSLTDIMKIIPNLSKYDGSAEDATLKATPKNSALGEKVSGSRFIYCAKPSKREKNLGLGDEVKEKQGARPNSKDNTGKFPDHDHRESGGNNHPTVKSTRLMSYLINMITPPQGVVLDPFLGSGSTGVSAITDGFDFIGIEKDAEYMEIAKRRIYHAFPSFQKQIHVKEKK